MKKNMFIYFFALMFLSCKEDAQKIIHYEFEGVKVSRYDLEKRTYLYYGECNNAISIKKNVSLIIDWQFDDFLQASLIFHKDRKVQILSGGGGKFKQISRKNEIYFKEYGSPEYNKIMDQYAAPNDLNNLCYIFDNTQFELEENKKLGSKVVITDELENAKICR
ncbi:hypothetical protein HQN84_07205 [Pedobacter steynii]|nr:hypothetical protein [Pedobacter steynii]NQX38630.1 hypothetical protein [Pedobacter steynii]